MRPISWFFMTLCAVLIAVSAWRFLLFPDLIVREGWSHHLTAFPVVTYVHFSLGPLALIIGAFQFMGVVPGKHHRALGQIYVVCCLFAGLAGLLLAINAEGFVAASGFLLLAILWIITTLVAYIYVRLRMFDLHRDWMIRSYALTYAAVTLRIMVLMAVLTGYEGAYQYIAWLCWLVNIAVVEIYMWRKKGRQNQGSGAH